MKPSEIKFNLVVENIDEAKAIVKETEELISRIKENLKRLEAVEINCRLESSKEGE